MISILDLPGEIIAKILRQVDAQTFKNAVYAGMKCREWMTKHDRAMHKFDLRKYGAQSWKLFVKTRGKKKAIHFKYYAAHGVPIAEFRRLILSLFETGSIGALKFLHELGLVGKWIDIDAIARADALKSLQFAHELGALEVWNYPVAFLSNDLVKWDASIIEFLHNVKKWEIPKEFLEAIYLAAIKHDRADILEFLIKKYGFDYKWDGVIHILGRIKVLRFVQLPIFGCDVLKYHIEMGKFAEFRYLLSLTKFGEEEVWQMVNLRNCANFLMDCDLALLEDAVKYGKLAAAPQITNVKDFMKKCCVAMFEIVFNAGKLPSDDKDIRHMFYCCGQNQQIEIFNFLRAKSRGIFRDLEFADALLKHSSAHCDVVMDILQYLHYGADNWFRKRTIAKNANAQLYNYLVSMNPAYAAVLSERYLPYAIKGENYYMIDRIMRANKCEMPKNIRNISVEMFRFLAKYFV